MDKVTLKTPYRKLGEPAHSHNSLLCLVYLRVMSSRHKVRVGITGTLLICFMTCDLGAASYQPHGLGFLSVSGGADSS